MQEIDLSKIVVERNGNKSNRSWNKYIQCWNGSKIFRLAKGNPGAIVKIQNKKIFWIPVLGGIIVYLDSTKERYYFKEDAKATAELIKSNILNIHNSFNE